MKFFSVVSLVTFLVAVASYAQDTTFEERDEYSGFEARDFVDELSTRETHTEPINARDYINELATRQLHEYARREALFEGISTRDLVDELDHRLARRANKKPKHPVPHGNSGSKPPPYVCPYCGSSYSTAQEAIDCSKFCKAK